MKIDRKAGEPQMNVMGSKKPWTTPAFNSFPACAAENQPFSPNRGDGVTGCGS